MNLLPLLAFLVSQQQWRLCRRGSTYRFVGTLQSRGRIDVKELSRKMQFFGARDVQIGERAPHRVAWTSTMGLDIRFKLEADIALAEGVIVRLHSVRRLPGSSVVVGSPARC